MGLRPTCVFNWTTGDEWLSLTCYGRQRPGSNPNSSSNNRVRWPSKEDDIPTQRTETLPVFLPGFEGEGGKEEGGLRDGEREGRRKAPRRPHGSLLMPSEARVRQWSSTELPLPVVPEAPAGSGMAAATADTPLWPHNVEHLTGLPASLHAWTQPRHCLHSPQFPLPLGMPPGGMSSVHCWPGPRIN